MQIRSRFISCAAVLMLAFSCVGCAATSSSESSSSAVSDAALDSSAQTAVTVSGGDSTGSADAGSSLANGQYDVKVSTGSSMFHVNEADEGRGVLTVTDEGMTVHIRLVSKKITNLYVGTAEQAMADEAGILQPTTDKVTYRDGYEEEVYGFDIPVPALDQAFSVAILGSKGNWYDHEVTVSDPIAK